MNDPERVMFLMTAMYIFFCFLLRSLLKGIELVNLRERDIKARKAGQSFREWISCSRFRDVIPRYVLYIYYIILLVNTIGFLFVGFLFIKGEYSETNWSIFRSVFAFNGIWFFLLLIVSFDPNYHNPRLELWIPNIKTGKTAKRYKHRKTTSGRHR